MDEWPLEPLECCHLHRGPPIMSLEDRTLFITGASRGIDLAIAKRAARDGANVAIVAKTEQPNPKLPGTIHTAAEEIVAVDGRALPIPVDIRDDARVQEAARRCAEHFGGIDILVNNASAISLTGTLETSMKRFDLMFGVNVRGTYSCSQACLPHLKAAAKAGRNPHILNLSPPLNMNPKWFKSHVAYTMAKYGMSMCAIGMAEEILADAAYAIFRRDARRHTGNIYIDEDVLAAEGITDLDRYAVVPGTKDFLTDLFLD